MAMLSVIAIRFRTRW